ncbi:MAG: DUF29 domain-containing protein [Xenococcaceae cyanobacterium MO_234.B1]|nr:DUF29 domain-containing protein [Xenococcaceae cyanobacterium MO_234.B1]
MLKQYNQDYYQWSQEQSRLLRSHQFNLLDIENLAEEIESLGKSDRRKLESFFTRLLEHLLKRRYIVGMPECFRGWDIEIRNFRKEINKLLKDSPSLKNYLQEIASECYEKALASVSEDYEIYDFTGGLDMENLEAILENKKG